MTTPSMLPADQLTAFNHVTINKWTDSKAIPLLRPVCILIQGYECLITMDMEVDLVWKSKWNLTKILYLLNRYAIIADAIVLELHYFGTNVTICKPILFAAGVLYICGIFVSESILIARVAVVWKMTMDNLCAIVPRQLLAPCTSSSIYSEVIYFSVFTILPFEGCFADTKGVTLWKEYTCLLIYDANRRPYQQSSLMRHVHVEGMTFLLKMSNISFNAPQESSSTSTFSVGLVMQLAFPDDIFLFVVPSCIIRSILAGRVVLHIREFGARSLGSASGSALLLSERSSNRPR
ncbi:hypothetical protein AGABI1DRAFT_89716 [Agaricus bisporus var. burnettii JB137-S8]|uniref:DUF6533 domain-containing protein n=1 Tax=Agaricus bisporus var. burnettii (strain JB137-S8 / ATCC MYA-4627 / FGSC 10392) TaxID=597362 RepID=K5W8F4_AGABU|nr:uncharacterized protein AGABI1DRAFT_89716 [Agaricus bisporus var. burnettii JB137-S8]EKM83114.1 hypothetical protein AGABI1DRAFT_89716 [Agaricus bisporus var. burnettii JB137-S8]